MAEESKKSNHKEVETPTMGFQEERQEPIRGLYKIVLNKNLRFEYGGIMYDLKKGKVYEVSADLRELLKKGGHLEVY